jgi:hypothetical protein
VSFVQELIKYFATEWAVIRQAPATFLLGAAILAGVMFAGLRFHFEGIIAEKDATIDELKTRPVAQEGNLDQLKLPELKSKIVASPKCLSLRHVHEATPDEEIWKNTHATVRFSEGGLADCPEETRWNIWECFAIKQRNDVYRVILVFDHPIVFGDFRLAIKNEKGQFEDLPNSLHSVEHLGDEEKVVASIFVDKSIAAKRKWILIKPTPWTPPKAPETVP